MEKRERENCMSCGRKKEETVKNENIYLSESGFEKAERPNRDSWQLPRTYYTQADILGRKSILSH